MDVKKRTKMCKTRNKKKKFVLLVAFTLLLFVGAGSTMAFLVDGTEPVINTFTPSKVTCEVVETFENNVKSNVMIQNTGDTDAYIRAAIVVTWKDDNGNVYAEKPVISTDYTISFDNDWISKDGYYYYPSAIKPNGQTAVLIEKCTPVSGKAPEGYTLSVEILAEAIQSSPDNAVEEAWHVNVSNGRIQ